MLLWMCSMLCAAAVGAEPGPRLSDADFFARLNLSDPALVEVQSAVQKKDWPATRTAFGEHFRKSLKLRWLAEPSPHKSVEAYDAERAGKILSHQFRFSTGQWFDLGPKIDWASNQLSQGESATIEWSSQLNRHFHLQQLARAYEATNDEKYADEIVAQLLSWIADCPLLTKRSGNSPYHHAWETLNTAIRAGDVWPNTLCRILQSRALTSDALCTIAKSLVEHADHLDRWPTRRGNWLTAESKGLYAVGTLLAECREAGEWRRHAMERLARQLETDVYPDGLEVELALGYSNWVLANFAFVLELAKQNGRAAEFPSDYLSRLERMYDYLTYAAMPNGTVPGLNDAGNASPTTFLTKGAGYFPERQDFLWVATHGKKGIQPQKTSVAFPYSGHYVMRSDWEPDARYLLLDAGPYGAAHQHEDKLHFVAFGYGRQLLLDAGSYMYDRSRWRSYVRSTRGHNTIRVDECDQNARSMKDQWVLPEPFQPSGNTWVSTEGVDYVVGRYDLGYGPDASIKVTHSRAIVFVKPDYWIIMDTLTPQDEGGHRYESLFHLNAEDATIEKETHAVTTAENKVANVLLWPLCEAALDAEIIKGAGEEPVQGWAASPWRPVPTAIFRTRVAGKTHIATIVYPLAAGQTSPIASACMLPVAAGGKPASDAAAIQIRFRDGKVHTVLVAENANTSRCCGEIETKAELFLSVETAGNKASLHYP